MDKMKAIMDNLRANAPEVLGQAPVTGVVDYQTGSGVLLPLPRSNVLEFQSETSKVLVRPAGTEPKVKIYLSSKAPSMDQAKAMNASILEQFTRDYMN